MTNDELEAKVFSSLGEPFLRGALDSVFLARRRATEESRKELAETEVENIVGILTRQYLEGYLRSVASRSPHLSSDVFKSKGSGWNHTEVRGSGVVLTAASVPFPGAMIEESNCRLELAQTNMPTFWDDPSNEVPETIYAVLTHSRSRCWENVGDALNFGRLPGSVYLVFPSATLDYYIHRVNLIDRYPDVVARNMPPDFGEGAKARWIDYSVANYFTHG